MSERRKFKKRFCKYCETKVDYIDYKDTANLKFSLSERYKIMPRRLTGNCKRHQDMITIAIKRARAAALVPYTINRKVVVNNPFENLR
ncbi:MAG: 30S ribosomal protein S18 [Campylobacterota bacterium]|nr:30S ribosomal protein S18 [Campylobacterota bacterium]